MFSWISSNNCFNNRERVRTHNIMTGGILGVPEEDYDHFLFLYAREVSMKNKMLSYSEVRTDPVFKLYFDIDILDEKEIDDDFLYRMSTKISSVVRTYFHSDVPEEKFMSVICTTTPKKVLSEDKEYTKSGYHIIFPNLYTDLNQTLQFRYNIVYELEKEFGKRENKSNPWSDIIDKAPYSNGLKMCGSHKNVKCESCKKKDPNDAVAIQLKLKEITELRKKIFPRYPGYKYSDFTDIHSDEFKDSKFGELYGNYMELTGYTTCPECSNTGSHVEDRTYMPYKVVSSDGSILEDETSTICDNLHEAMRMTSIRCSSSDVITPGFSKPSGIPSVPLEDTAGNLRNVYSKRIFDDNSTVKFLRKDVVNNDISLGEVETCYRWKGIEIHDQDKVDIIQNFIRQKMGSHYENICVKTVTEMNIARPIEPTTGKNPSKKQKSIKVTSFMTEGCSYIQPTIEMVVHRRLAIRVTGVGSCFCENKGDDHRSSTVYFWITPHACYQRCFSKKEVVQMGGGKKCSEYYSDRKDIGTKLSRVLFPDNNGISSVVKKATSAVGFAGNIGPCAAKKVKPAIGKNVCKKNKKKSGMVANAQYLKT